MQVIGGTYSDRPRKEHRRAPLCELNPGVDSMSWHIDLSHFQSQRSHLSIMTVKREFRLTDLIYCIQRNGRLVLGLFTVVQPAIPVALAKGFWLVAQSRHIIRLCSGVKVTCHFTATTLVASIKHSLGSLNIPDRGCSPRWISG